MTKQKNETSTPPKLNIALKEMMVGRILSFWDGLFSGAMLNFQGVRQTKMTSLKTMFKGISFSREPFDESHVGTKLNFETILSNGLGSMGTHVSFSFRGYNPYVQGLNPSFFHGLLGSKGRHPYILTTDPIKLISSSTLLELAPEHIFKTCQSS